MLSSIHLKLNKNATNNTHIIRLLDIFIAILGIIITSPFILLIAIFIRIESKGPSFFIQERLGLNKSTFNLYKFRTMKVDAEINGPQWSKKDDPRITATGIWLRKTRLDELPQLFNILKGDLSIVGPRPIRAHFANILQEIDDNYEKRFLTKPGLTGWAQIYAPYGSTVEEQLEKLPYDLKYLDSFTILNYFILIIMTTKVVFSGKGV